MLRRATRRVLPKRDQWHGLQEFAVADTDAVAFRDARAADAAVKLALSAGTKNADKIDWAQWEKGIAHTDVVSALKNFHEQQTALLDGFAGADHKAAVEGSTAGWSLFDAAVASCEKSVQQSDSILRNGARALYISHNNPAITQASQSEWIDADQYWAAFVEKHHYYHSHMNFGIEDPESKEYDAKQNAEIVGKWKKFDGKGQTRFNNKMLYQRPSYEHYNLYRGVFVEHMMFYLTKTGGDARFFPQTMPYQWFGEIYDCREEILSVLQRRKRQLQERTLARVVEHEMMPTDMVGGGEAYYASMIQKQNALVELQVGRLMGNFIFLSDAVPVQTKVGLDKALAIDGGKGSFYSLGSDVHCVFYVPASVEPATPVNALNSYLDHLAVTGRKLPVGYAQGLTAFHKVLETRASGLSGQWFAVGEESQAEAFLRRVSPNDPSYAIYKTYVAEMTERLANKTAVPHDKVAALVAEIEPKYNTECDVYQQLCLQLNDDLLNESKAEDTLAQLHEAGELADLMNSGNLVAVRDGKALSATDLAEDMTHFEEEASKVVDAVMSKKAAFDKELA
jgi:hypothetical protein